MSRQQKLNIFGNAILFQLLWLAAVLGAARQLQWPGIIALIVLIAWSLWFGRKVQADLRMAFIGLLIAFSIEPIWIGQHYLAYQLQPGATFPPLWIVCLWVGFAVSFNHCLHWLKDRYLWAMALGAVGSLLSISAAMGLGALTTPRGWPGLALFYGPVWAVLVPALAWISGGRRSDEATDLKQS